MGTGKGLTPEPILLTTVLSEFFVNFIYHRKLIAALSGEKARKAQIV